MLIFLLVFNKIETGFDNSIVKNQPIFTNCNFLEGKSFKCYFRNKNDFISVKHYEYLYLYSHDV